MQREVHDSVPERETCVPQMRISASKCETRILLTPKCETNVLPVLERNSHIFYTKCEVRDLRQTQPMLRFAFQYHVRFAFLNKNAKSMFSPAEVKMQSQKALILIYLRLVLQMPP